MTGQDRDSGERGYHAIFRHIEGEQEQFSQLTLNDSTPTITLDQNFSKSGMKPKLQDHFT